MFIHVKKYLNKSRNIFKILLILVLIIFQVSCNSKKLGSENQQLVIANFGGDWGNAQRKIWFDEFEKKYNVKIIDIEYNGDYNLLKSKASSGEWDIIDIEELEMLRGVSDGLWKAIDYKNINKDFFIDKSVLNYAVGSVGYSIVIGYDSEKIKSDDVKGWVSFISPNKIPGKRGVRTSPQYFIEGVWLANGRSLTELYSMPIEQSKPLIRNYLQEFKNKIGKNNIITFETYGQPQDMIERKSVVMAYGTNGRMMAKKIEGKNIGVCWNQSILTIEYYVISKKTKHAEFAQKFIDFILNKENQAKMGRFIPYGPVNKEAFNELSKSEKSLLPTSPEIYPNTVSYNASWWLKYEKEIREIYQEFLLL